jgi:Putative Flp pilus-assembly TadE/G-like
MKFLAMIRKLAGNRSGNFATVFALLAPIMFGVVGGAVDLVVYNRQFAKMQDAADSAVLAATREATLKNWSQQEAAEVAKAYVTATLEDAGLSSTAAFDIQTVADSINKKVSITLDMDQHRFFMLGYFRANPQIRVFAEARLSSETPVCMISLDGTQAKAVNLFNYAQVKADGCAVYSNSSSKDGLYVSSTSTMKSAYSCSGGGFGTGVSVFSPTPTVDCPPMDDPLSQRPQPTVGGCDYTDFAVKNDDQVLSPGVYCGGILIDNKANVTLKPGVYIINGGVLRTRNSGSLIGDGVTLFFTGGDGRLQIDGTSTVNLTAPATGDTAGILMMQDRAMEYTEFEISAKVAAELLGTIYFPNGHLKMLAPGNLAEKSAFTVVVARTYALGANTRMYLNSNYDATPVPVPAGLGPSRAITLVR